mmetsp:Transcript_8250/g.20407  ORF Transcript_8250/g.20407 Transcript_8250/m.20407 type:complete len:211 (-) Transcript_8250:41-673(-)|eukprot:CAMPEP_0172392694 /NCGR_PEP_ID=MMETSP1061-20121228/8739_1 /TAXON_ID=37318 /ORGANISM="Pseudo-nitzschia pungens, Strain cf. pungens" /LENGTH=210 /DNA_ID=CAMNT_0013123573 /DNA_START=241 /DNA_END=873 /DNA_ORIENTATION=+
MPVSMSKRNSLFSPPGMKIVKQETSRKSFGAAFGSVRGGVDFVSMRSNPYILDIFDDNEDDDDDDDDDDENNGSDKEYGRKIRHVPRLLYTPVQVSSRKSLGSGGVQNSYQRKRSITADEMDELNTSLGSLFVGDTQEKAEKTFDPAITKTEPNHRTGATAGQEAEYYNLDENGNPMGRIPKFHFDPKTGRRSTVLRSARSAKKMGLFTL